jgi:hypothetical protein
MCPFDSALTAQQTGWRLEAEDTAGGHREGWEDGHSPVSDTGDPWCFGRVE